MIRTASAGSSGRRCCPAAVSTGGFVPAAPGSPVVARGTVGRSRRSLKL